MRVTALTWNRYRSFKERQSVELARVTVVIGRNGSGKSIISRLPLLLASGVSGDAIEPLDLSAGGIEHAASYQDLVNARGALPFSLGLRVSNGRDAYEFETTLRHVNETKMLAIEAFWLRANGSEVLRADLADADELTKDTLEYNLRSDGAVIDARKIPFNGLLPSVEPFDGVLREALEQARAAFRQALPLPSYLGPFRVGANRLNPVPSRQVRSLGPQGERAIEFLAEDKLRYGSELVNRVSDWFSSHLGQGISIHISDDQTQVRVVDHSGIDVSLSDTGAGFTQVLPIVVQNIAHVEGRLPTSMLIVEQPELHLHPGAHGAVADLILHSSLSAEPSPQATCIVETHSEQFIMRLRRRIAEGLDPNIVALWSLNHRESADEDATIDPLRPITFDPAGGPSAWPSGVFEETFRDLAALRQAARERA
jgi:hypothetical protein